MLPDWRKPEKHAVESIGTTEIHASGKAKAAVSDIDEKVRQL